jgi:LPS-assembly protein
MRFAMPDLSFQALAVKRFAPCDRVLALVLVCVAFVLTISRADAQSPWPNLTPQAPASSAPETRVPLQLRMSPKLLDQIDPSIRSELPTFIFGDRMSGRPDLETLVEGNAIFRRGDTVIRADRLEYYQPSDQAKAQGRVLINRAGNVFEGPSMEIKVDSFEGFFMQPRYRFLANEAYGDAERVDFLDDKRAVIRNATFTTCQRVPGPSWLPDWFLRAAVIRVDSEDEVGEAEDAKLNFKGVTILSLPSVSFSLSEKRKSGFLAPTFSVDNISGTEVTAPYYWNIAPNRDATFYPTVMSMRGVDLGGEFRYLEPTYGGRLRANYMPGDLLRDSDRWGMAYLHNGVIKTGLSNVGNIGLNLSLNRVSDDDYWRDFPRGTTSLTQRLLASDASLTWGKGSFSTTLRALKWQTLQDVTSPITPPYDRLPQITARYSRFDLRGLDLSVDGDYTQFEGNQRLTGQPNSQRNVLLLQMSRPWLGSAGYITPKLQMHATTYQFDSFLANGDNSASRAVPTLSLDSGLVFERNATYLGSRYTQTLEPRLFYVNTPYVNQSNLPNYDSGAYDFNFATIYTENAFVGNDRIADNNLLTAGVSTRFLKPESGAEVARFSLAQRYRFVDQNVTLPGGVPAKASLSDVLLGASVNWDKRWLLDTTVQYNPTTEKSTRATVGARYNPGSYRVLNMAYRFQRDVNGLVANELVDMGWQWPLNDLWGDKGKDLGAGRGQGAGRWYSVGRLNYSLQDAKLVDSILGFEYDAGCWLGRVVLERLSTGLVTVNQRIMFQLEFVGFSRVGIDPLQTLKRNIPRYQNLREQTTSPSRFSNYD